MSFLFPHLFSHHCLLHSISSNLSEHLFTLKYINLTPSLWSCNNSPSAYCYASLPQNHGRFFLPFRCQFECHFLKAPFPGCHPVITPIITPCFVCFLALITLRKNFAQVFLYFLISLVSMEGRALLFLPQLLACRLLTAC